eukprot:1194344-Prorocentrum_minimum.AAC.7
MHSTPRTRVSLRGRVRSELGFGARQGSTYRGAAATRQQRPVSHERHEARPRQLAPQGVRVLDGLDVLSQPRRVQAGEEQRPLHKLGQQIHQHLRGGWEGVGRGSRGVKRGSRDARRWMLDSGRWTLDPGHWTLDARRCL